MKKTVPVITLIRQGKPVVRKAALSRSLSVGRQWGADLLDPHCGVDRQRVLSRSPGGGFTLHLPAGATAHFSRGSSRLALDAMVAWGLARTGKKGFEVPLRPGTLAEFSFGGDDYRLEFAAPASLSPVFTPVPTGTVPLRYRWTPPDREDRMFAILILSTLTLTAIALSLLSRIPLPPPGVVAIKQMPARISKLLLQSPPRPKAAPAPIVQPVPLVPPVAGAVEGRPGTSGERSTLPSTGGPRATGPIVGPAAGAPGGGGAGPGANRAAVRAKVSNMGVLGILSGKGTAGRSGHRSRAVTALQLDSSLEQNLDQVLSEVQGITVAGGGGEGDGPGGGGTGPGQGGANAQIIGIGRQVEGAVGAPVKVARLGTIKGAPVAASGSRKALEPEQREERSSRAIAKVVDSHTGAIRYAYNKELRRNPALKGKIVLRFTIAPEGMVTDCRLEESTMGWQPLESALIAMAGTWKFPPIPEGVVTVTYPFIFFPSM